MTFTSRLIAITAATVQTPVQLQDLLNVINESRYDGSIPGSGWGSVLDGSEELLGSATEDRPHALQAELVEASGKIPTYVRARYYWHKRTPSSSRSVDDPAWRRYFLKAADVIFTLGVDDSTLICLMGARTDPDLSELTGGVRKLIEDADSGASLSFAADPLDLGPGDFYLWMLNRAEVLADEEDDPLVLGVPDARAQGGSSGRYSSHLSNGTALERVDQQALVADATTRWRSCKADVRSKHLKLSVRLEISADSAFTIYPGKTNYDVDPDAPALSRMDFRLKLVPDVAFVLLPELVTRHQKDAAWSRGGRDKYRSDAKTTLYERNKP